MKKLFTLILAAALSIGMFNTATAFADEVSAKDDAYTLPNSDNLTTTDKNSENSDKYTNGSDNKTDVSTAQNTTSDDNSDNSAEGTNDVTTEPTEDNKVVSDISSDKLYFEFKMIPRMQVIDSTAVFEVYDTDGNLTAVVSEWVGGITEKLSFEVNVRKYMLGESLTVKLKSGLTYVQYYDKTYGVGDEIKLDTYVYTDEEGNNVIGNSFAFDACPEYEHLIIVYVNGKQLNLNPRARLIDDTAMIPLRAVAEEIGFDVTCDEHYRSVVCSVGGEQALFNLDQTYATIFGIDIYMSKPCTTIDGNSFVSARSFADAIGSSIEALDFGDHIDVCIGDSPKVTEYKNRIPVNKWGIDSKTNYLVWIDKSDYLVRVYTGSRYNWKPEISFPCAIGAPGSPTVTGSYEYLYRMPGWYYDGYYVGPCLVFYGNYALHSTLLRYDNTPYDNRVGVMISHGCVRLRKGDIDWLDSHLPKGSRIYITE